MLIDILRDIGNNIRQITKDFSHLITVVLYTEVLLQTVVIYRGTQDTNEQDRLQIKCHLCGD